MFYKGGKTSLLSRYPHPHFFFISGNDICATMRIRIHTVVLGSISGKIQNVMSGGGTIPSALRFCRDAGASYRRGAASLVKLIMQLYTSLLMASWRTLIVG
jgi:hypothetical protein